MRKHRLVPPELLIHKAIHVDHPNGAVTMVDVAASTTPAGRVRTAVAASGMWVMGYRSFPVCPRGQPATRSNSLPSGSMKLIHRTSSACKSKCNRFLRVLPSGTL